MILDEAIKHCKEKAKELSEELDYIVDEEAEKACVACMAYHEQLAEWLEDYKRLLEERPQGEWLHPYKIDIACECSNCRMQMPITDYFNFCPNCGADMRKGGME